MKYWVLWLLKVLYQGAIGLRNFLFDNKILPVFRSSVPVISVGNLTAGGTGKTPWVGWLTEKMTSQGYKVAIVSRGYGRKSSGVLEVQVERHTALETGDEPFLLAQKYKVPVYVSASRKKGIQALLAKHSVDVIVLDDGFQHRYVHRDLNIVLFDASVSKSHYQVLPLGHLREPWKALWRGDLVVANKWKKESSPGQSFLLQKIREFSSRSPFILSSYKAHRPLALDDKNETSFPADNFLLACGIAHSHHFLATVRQAVGEPRQTLALGDHCPWSLSQREELRDLAVAYKVRDILVTEKDGVKLKQHLQWAQEQGLRLWFLPISLEIVESNNDAFPTLSEEQLWQKIQSVLPELQGLSKTE